MDLLRPPSRWPVVLAAAVLAAAALAAYHNSLSAPFVFDDVPAIAENPTIRHLWPLGPVLAGPVGGQTASGRPLVNLSLALNFALGGTDVRGYHALNLSIHILAALTLFGLARRTLQIAARAPGVACPPNPGEGGPDSAGRETSFPTLLAFLVALLWAVHPLQTESVTYVVQRAESLMGLFYLLTLYFFIRYAEGDGTTEARRLASVAPLPASISTGWAALSVLACLCGMASKEVMVTAPVMVFLFDRTFTAGGFREAWRRRKGYYGALAATWLLLGALLAKTGGNRGGTIGFNLGVSWWAYALTQFKAVAYYLRAAFWPHPLVFEYGTYWVRTAGEVAPYALAVLPLLVATGVALWRRPALGFLGCWFFLILAPTSSVVPGVSQMIVEHRMYLPLAAVLAGAVLGMEALFRRFLPSGRPWGAPVCCLLAAAALARLTVLRNEDYRSELSLWEKTVAQRPGNSWAQCNLGVALFAAGRIPEAIARYRTALELNPRNAEAQWNLADALAQSGRVPEALALYASALRAAPGDAKARCNLGNTLCSIGRTEEGIAEYEESLRLNPDSATARNDLARALAGEGRLPEAIVQYRRAVRLKPDDASINYNLGSALAQAQQPREAIAYYHEALRLRPGYAEARNNLGNALARLGRLPEAIAEYVEAVRLRPDYVEARCNDATALAQLGRPEEARAQWREVVRLRPGFGPALEGLASLPDPP